MRREMMEEIALYEELAPKLRENPEDLTSKLNVNREEQSPGVKESPDEQKPKLRENSGKLSTKEDLETTDCFTCSFCKEEFTIAELYKQHVIDEHYRKSVGTFWNQACFQEKS